MKKALVVGYGFVGKATYAFLESFDDIEIFIHDPYLEYPSIVDEEEEFDFVFLCLPTDLKKGALDISTLKKMYGKWKGEQIIRSTIGPDQVNEFDDPTMYPEFLREVGWEQDVKQPQVEHVLGYNHASKFAYFLQENDIEATLVSPEEAAMFKISRNAFLSMKVMYANILNKKCKQYDVSYKKVKSLLQRNLDPTTHFDVPGPDGQFGFGGKCLPKDTTHFKNLDEDPLFTTILDLNKVIR